MDLGTLIGFGRKDAVARVAAERDTKGRRIAAIVATYRRVRGATVVDFGCGLGDVAQAFADAGANVIGADVENRLRFDLPFVPVRGQVISDLGDDVADILLSNHVLEHVGDVRRQRRYLAECWRLLKPEGVMYFAKPNRWTVFEPHYRLPFLSWPPQRYRSAYLRLLVHMGIAVKIFPDIDLESYNCWPHSRRTTRRLVSGAGFQVEDITADMVQRYLPGVGGWIVYRLFAPIVPATVLICRK